MGTYIIRRILLMIPTLIGITMVVFLVMALSPGGTTAMLKNTEMNMRPAEREALRKYYNKRYGLDKPLPVQYMRWLNQVSPVGFEVDEEGHLGRFGLKAPNLGESYLRRRPVVDVVMEALPITLLLNLIELPIAYGISITTGIFAARYRGKTFDVASGTIFLALWSLPVMWVGVMCIGFLANRDYLAWFPTGGLHDLLADQMRFLPSWDAAGFHRGWLLDFVWHLVLPIACMTYGSFAFLSKLMRASVLENLTADFARTARAKGLPDRIVLFRHVLANSVLPLITVAAGILPSLLGGSVIIESLFSINGMGRLMFDAVRMKDQELIMSETLVIGLIGLACLLIADIGYAIADPRVSYE
jgi:peptide/nickel transport system permease protein